MFLLTAIYLVPFHITIATNIGRNWTIDNSIGKQFSTIRIIAKIAILKVINVVIRFSFGSPSIYLGIYTENKKIAIKKEAHF